MVNPRPWLATIAPYRPGSRSQLDIGSMASNESPLGASPNVALAAAEAIAVVHRYPDPLADVLRNRLADHHGVHPDQILVGNGSDELIYLLMWAFAAKGGRVVCADPAYQLTEISAYVAGAQLRKVPLAGWSHDLQAMARAEADIAYICNPHNPAGTVVGRCAIEEFVARTPAELVVVDEAYIDFADDPDQMSVVSLAADGEVAVLRTFSKAHGLAGLRIGYLVGEQELISVLRKIRPPFSVNCVAQASAAAALADRQHWAAVRTHVIDYRQRVTQLLESHGYDVVPSQANFVLVRTREEDRLVAVLAAHDVAVRRGSDLGMPGTVRISVPSAPGFRLLADSLATVARSGLNSAAPRR